MSAGVCDKTRGFTLLEIIIVLVIMGCMLVFAGPRVARSLGMLKLKTTAKAVAAHMRRAHSQAVNTGRLYHVIFDAEKTRVIIRGAPRPAVPSALYGDNATAAQENEELEAEDQPAAGDQRPEIIIYKLPAEIRFHKIAIAASPPEEEEGDDIYQLAFFPDGTSQGGEIILQDAEERMYAITVEFLTGAVSVGELEDE